ncbi:MAG: hypothetical protein JSS72_00070 [Armatimonadetes bacterium]|nr:hypothetical protein [Armatimonadota bacterium]
MRKSYLLPSLALIAIVGCAPKNKLLGTWESTVAAGPASVTTTTTYKDDGSFNASVEIKGGPVPTKASYTGTYKLDKDDLTTTVDPKTVVLDPPDDNFKNMVVGSLKSQTAKLSWNGESQFSIPAGPMTVVFNKK